MDGMYHRKEPSFMTGIQYLSICPHMLRKITFPTPGGVQIQIA